MSCPFNSLSTAIFHVFLLQVPIFPDFMAFNMSKAVTCSAFFASPSTFFLGVSCAMVPCSVSHTMSEKLLKLLYPDFVLVNYFRLERLCQGGTQHGALEWPMSSILPLKPPCNTLAPRLTSWLFFSFIYNIFLFTLFPPTDPLTKNHTRSSMPVMPVTPASCITIISCFSFVVTSAGHLFV